MEFVMEVFMEFASGRIRKKQIPISNTYLGRYLGLYLGLISDYTSDFISDFISDSLSRIYLGLISECNDGNLVFVVHKLR